MKQRLMSKLEILRKNMAIRQLRMQQEQPEKLDAKALIANHISARFMPSDIANLKEQGKAIFPALYIAEDFAQYEWKDGTRCY